MLLCAVLCCVCCVSLFRSVLATASSLTCATSTLSQQARLMPHSWTRSLCRMPTPTSRPLWRTSARCDHWGVCVCVTGASHQPTPLGATCLCLRLNAPAAVGGGEECVGRAVVCCELVMLSSKCLSRLLFHSLWPSCSACSALLFSVRQGKQKGGKTKPIRACC